MLAAIFPRWLAAFLVGAALVGSGGAAAKKGLDAIRQEDLVPRQTLEATRETASELTQAATSGPNNP